MASKEIRVEVRLRNNILYHAIYDNWKSVAAFCRDKGFNNMVIGELLNLKLSPIYKRSGEYKDICRRLAQCFRILEEDLFPLYIYNLEKKKMIREISIAEIGWREIRQVPFFEDPLKEMEEKERAEAIEEVLGRLTYREREMLRMYYSLAGYSGHTLKEAGREFGVSVERARQVIAKALRILRHPDQTSVLKEHL